MQVPCKVVGCKHTKARRYLLCKPCWNKIPKNLQHPLDLRPVSKEEHSFTLRAVPPKQWFEKVIPYVGMIKIPYIMGAGYSAVKIAADKKEA